MRIIGGNFFYDRCVVSFLKKDKKCVVRYDFFVFDFYPLKKLILFVSYSIIVSIAFVFAFYTVLVVMYLLRRRWNDSFETIDESSADQSANFYANLHEYDRRNKKLKQRSALFVEHRVLQFSLFAYFKLFVAISRRYYIFYTRTHMYVYIGRKIFLIITRVSRDRYRHVVFEKVIKKNNKINKSVLRSLEDS